MNKKFLIILSTLLLSISSVFSEEYTAFSLKSAQRLTTSNKSDSNVRQMAGITHLVAAVYDKDNDDIILVGKKGGKYPPISLDDWAVAARSVLKLKQDPAVSIDPTDETKTTKMQKVRFEGGLEDTQFGKDLLAADVVLKRLGLSTLSAEIFDLSSYLDLSVIDYNNTGKRDDILSRFWFLPDKKNARVTAQDGLIVAEEYRILVNNQIMMEEEGLVTDPPGELFAQDLHSKFNEVKLYYPELARMEQLYFVTAIAQGIESGGMSKSSTLSFWRDKFKVKEVSTQKEYPLEKNSAEGVYQGKVANITVSGGIDFDVMIYRMQSGGIEEIKNYVIKSRPEADSLCWDVPLFKCVLEENYDSAEIEAIAESEKNKRNFGTSLLKTFNTVQATVNPTAIKTFNVASRPLSTHYQLMNFNTQLTHQRSPNVGGVMLENVAKVSGDDNSFDPLDMAGAKFSFMVDGKDARIDPKTFRKFITALWAVYYSNEDPGISIDPIAPGADKHMVRYIGQVINTDLGRVMRDADYIMKKWAVGTENPDIEGFKSPLDYAADAGMLSVGAWSRFWFVPKDMQFRRSDNMLLFEGGRMTVQTEYMFQGFGSGADPANQKFADFFTEHYDEIAKKYPVYQELYDYAKMVSLAKYLKDSGVPLFWFIMANKDLVITEDSIGTVDALIKNSKRFEGVQIEGGVELCSQGQYIYDNAAIEAINTARANMPSASRRRTSSITTDTSNQTIIDPVSFTMKDRSLTVLPQHSASSGKDYHGLRYQTDFAVREAGYQLTPKNCEKLQYEIFRLKYAKLLLDASDSEGNLPATGAELIIEECWNKAEANSTEIVNNLELLINKDIKSKAKFLSELEKYMMKKEYESWKDVIAEYAYYNTCLELVRCFNPNQKTTGDFGPGWNVMVPYQIKPANKETVEFQGIIIPKKMALVNKMSGKEEVLSFDADKFNAAAYVPEDIKRSQVVGLFIMTDGSFRLLDKIENEFEFNGVGYLTDMIFSERHIIHFEYQKDFAAALKKPPYKIERAEGKWIKFRTIRLPEKLKIINLVDGTSEEMLFTEEGALVGYEPIDPNNASVKFLALMNDLSYRMLDKNENELLFNQSGIFQKMISTSEEYLVESMSSGNYIVRFGYSISKKGGPIIVQATLHKEGEDEKDIVMSYEYGPDGRLNNTKMKDKNTEMTFNF